MQETPYNKKEIFRWKTFAIGGLSMKTAKVFHCERFALYGMYVAARIVSNFTCVFLLLYSGDGHHSIWHQRVVILKL